MRSVVPGPSNLPHCVLCLLLTVWLLTFFFKFFSFRNTDICTRRTSGPRGRASLTQDVPSSLWYIFKQTLDVRIVFPQHYCLLLTSAFSAVLLRWPNQIKQILLTNSLACSLFFFCEIQVKFVNNLATITNSISINILHFNS